MHSTKVSRRDLFAGALAFVSVKAAPQPRAQNYTRELIAAFEASQAGSGRLEIPPGTWGLTPVTLRLRRSTMLICAGRLLNSQADQLHEDLITIDGSQFPLSWSGGEIDLLGGARSGLHVRGGAGHTISAVKIMNLVGTPISGSSSSALVLRNASSSTLRDVQVQDVLIGSHKEGSVPRALSIDGTSTDIKIQNIKMRNVHCGMVIFANSVSIENCDLEGGADNGYYINGDGVSIHGGRIIDFEEPIVIRGGTGTDISNVTIAGYTNSLGVESCGSVSFRSCNIRMEGNTGSVIRTRSGNNNGIVESIEFNNCHIYSKNIHVPFLLNTGRVERFVIIDNYIKVLFDNRRERGVDIVRWSWGSEFTIVNNLLDIFVSHGDGLFNLPRNIARRTVQGNRLVADGQERPLAIR